MKKNYIKYLVLTFILSMPVSVLAKKGAVKRVSCGAANSNYLTDIPQKIPKLTSTAFFIIEVAVPVLIIIFGMIDLIKAITAGKEDEIKKAQGVIIKRLIVGVIIFFAFVIVKLLVRVVDEHSSGIINCMDCFINNKCSYKGK